jgi:mannosyltransferase
LIRSGESPSVGLPARGAGSTASAERTAVVLALLTLLAAALRFWRLGDWSFWADEIATLRDAQHLRNVITYPVGYALIGFVVRHWGPHEFAARLVPAIAGAISVPALYLIGRKLFSERAAVLSAVLLAVSSYHIFFSQEARYYTLMTLFSMLGMWCAFVGLEHNNRKALVGAVLLLALAGWTHWTAGLVLPALAVYALWNWRHEERPAGLRWSNLAILFGPFVAVGIFFARPVLSFLADWQARGGFSIGRCALTAAKLTDRYEPAVLIFAAVAAWALLQQRDRRGTWLLGWALAPPALVVVFVGFAEGGSRFALVALPAFLLLAGEGLDFLLRSAAGSRRKVAWLLVGLVIVSLGLKDAFYFTYECGERPRWREAAQYVRPRTRAEYARVMTAAPARPEVLEFYLSRTVPQVMGVVESKPATLAGLKKLPRNRVFYIIVEQTANARPEPELLKFLEENGKLVERLPLTVRFLDYSLLIYRLPAPTPSGP